MQNKTVTVSLVVALVALTVMGFVMKVSYQNTEVSVRNEIDAQTNINKATHDTMWKILNEQAGVADQYKGAFQEIYVQITDERYSGDTGALMSWIVEHNPAFDASLYKTVANSVAAERTKFLNSQTRLISLKNAHDNLRMKFPGTVFLRSTAPIEVTVVTSDKAEKVFEEGKDNDTLFGGK